MKRFDVRPRLAVACEQMLPTHEANAEDDHPEKPERVQACLAGDLFFEDFYGLKTAGDF